MGRSSVARDFNPGRRGPGSWRSELSYRLPPMSKDLPADEFRSAMHRVADLVADYLEGVGDRRVLPAVKPGEVRRVRPAAPPVEPEPLDTILDDYLRVIEPNLTHWN